MNKKWNRNVLQHLPTIYEYLGDNLGWLSIGSKGIRDGVELLSHRLVKQATIVQRGLMISLDYIKKLVCNKKERFTEVTKKKD